jgi:hypothetical protein
MTHPDFINKKKEIKQKLIQKHHHSIPNTWNRSPDYLFDLYYKKQTPSILMNKPVENNDTAQMHH